MKLHKSERSHKKFEFLALSPNSPYIYSPYLSPPLEMSTKKRANPAEVERWDPAAR
jgi:hypothetical protein